jgi:hypothetical protein
VQEPATQTWLAAQSLLVTHAHGPSVPPQVGPESCPASTVPPEPEPDEPAPEEDEPPELPELDATPDDDPAPPDDDPDDPPGTGEQEYPSHE